MIGILKQYAVLALKGAAIGIVVVGINRQFNVIGPANYVRHTY